MFIYQRVKYAMNYTQYYHPLLSLDQDVTGDPARLRRQGGRLSFLSALNAVMDVMSAGTGTAPVPLQAPKTGGKPTWNGRFFYPTI